MLKTPKSLSQQGREETTTQSPRSQCSKVHLRWLRLILAFPTVRAFAVLMAFVLLIPSPVTAQTSVGRDGGSGSRELTTFLDTDSVALSSVITDESCNCLLLYAKAPRLISPRTTFTWVRRRMIGEGLYISSVDPDTGAVIQNIESLDLDVSADGKAWFHLLGPQCFDDLKHRKASMLRRYHASSK